MCQACKYNDIRAHLCIHPVARLNTLCLTQNSSKQQTYVHCTYEYDYELAVGDTAQVLQAQHMQEC